MEKEDSKTLKLVGMPLGLHCPCVFALFIHTDKPWDHALCPSVGGCTPWCCLQGKPYKLLFFFVVVPSFRSIQPPPCLLR